MRLLNFVLKLVTVVTGLVKSLRRRPVRRVTELDLQTKGASLVYRNTVEETAGSQGTDS